MGGTYHLHPLHRRLFRARRRRAGKFTGGIPEIPEAGKFPDRPGISDARPADFPVNSSDAKPRSRQISREIPVKCIYEIPRYRPGDRQAVGFIPPYRGCAFPAPVSTERSAHGAGNPDPCAVPEYPAPIRPPRVAGGIAIRPPRASGWIADKDFSIWPIFTHRGSCSEMGSEIWRP